MKYMLNIKISARLMKQVFAIFLVALVFVFSNYRGESSYNKMHDNGDGLIAYQMKYSFDVVNDNRPHLFDSSMLGGFDRNVNAFSSKLPTLIYTIFSPWVATHIHLLLQLFISLLGIFLLLRLRFECSFLTSFLAVIVHLRYFTFEISEMFTVALIPLIILVISRKSVSNLLIIFLAFLYSWSSQISLTFYLAPFGVYFVVVMLNNWSLKSKTILNGAKFMVTYLVLESFNVLNLLLNVSDSHRSDWPWDTYGSGLNLDYLGGVNYNYYLLYIILLLSFFWIRNKFFVHVKKLLFFLLLLQIYLAFCGYFNTFANSLGYPIEGFNFSRFYLTFPLLIPILVGLLFESIKKENFVNE